MLCLSIPPSVVSLHVLDVHTRQPTDPLSLEEVEVAVSLVEVDSVDVAWDGASLGPLGCGWPVEILGYAARVAIRHPFRPRVVHEVLLTCVRDDS